MSNLSSIKSILTFWFGDKTSPDYGKPKSFWFMSTPEIDRSIQDTFGSLYELAVKGELDDWLKTPEGSLSLVIILDQLSRNMFRGLPQSFAGDSKALEVAKAAIEKRYDQLLPKFQCVFLYMPFMHSEKLKDQYKSVELFEALGIAVNLDYAIKHKEIIVRFGRFPHRNVILGRASTPEELEFLKEPGSSF